MSKDDLKIRLAKIEVSIEQIVERLDALDIAVSWLLAQQPDDSGYRFLCGLGNDIEDTGKNDGVASEVDLLRAYVAVLRGRHLPDP